MEWEENLPDSALRKELSLENPNVVYGHRPCQTNVARWLCLEKAYEKFHRSNFYDIGGTYIQDVPDYWFTCKTEQVGTIYLLHLFVCKRGEGSFNIAVSCGNELKINKKNETVHLPTSLKDVEFNNFKHKSSGNFSDIDDTNTFEYLTTYNFSDLDIEFMKGMKFFIAISFPLSEGLSLNLINDVKATHDCSALLTEPIGSDFTIETSDGKKFQVHKVILSVHSEVFKAMFKEETAESQNSYVKFVDVSGEDLRYMLEYIYTGTIKEMDNVDFVNLLMLADRYNLRGLCTLSQYALSEQITVSNALYTLVVADMYDSDNLKNSALKFIKKNVDSLKSSTFEQITNTKLMQELCSYLAYSE